MTRPLFARPRAAFPLFLLALTATVPLAGPLAGPLAAQAPAASLKAVKADKAAIDGVAASFYNLPNAPGAAILVAEGDQVLLEKGYGLASLELGVPIAPDMVFRLGSVTKQFTAVAILMLEEQGKLRLDQKVSEILTDYPKAQGDRIRIDHLLSHTGGIPNYTDDPEFWKIAHQYFTPELMYPLFADKPLEFEPGERFAYSNSGYWVLGRILEKVSGETYASFVEKHLFAPAGMKASYYDDPGKLIPRRTPGYQPNNTGGFAPAPFIHMSGPYAAGALASTVADLRRWNEALLAGKLIRPESLDKAWTPFTFNNGKKSHYGFGWEIGQVEGQRMVRHGGGIPGFMTMMMFFPEKKITVAVLSNGAALNPDLPAQGLVMAVFGNAKGYPRIELPAETLAKFEGVYRIDEKSRRVVKAEKDHLVTTRDDGPAFKAYPISSNEFVYDGQNDRVRFELGPDGKVLRMRMLRFGEKGDETAERTGEKIPEGPKFVEVVAEDLDRLLGNYELHPGFVLNVRREGKDLVVQATGQGPIGIKALSPTEFLSPEIGARIVFHLEAGKAQSLVLYQGGAEMPAKRLD